MQKTAYEMRISDWSADVCSSDLDPSQDPDVSALSDAQAESTRQFARTQIDNFMRRAEALHNGGGSAGAGMGLQFAFRDLPAMARQRYRNAEEASFAPDDRMRGGGISPLGGPDGGMRQSASGPRPGANENGNASVRERGCTCG